MGEITPAYAALAPEDVTQVRALLGPARILYIIRDPMERMWSQATKDMPRRTGLPLAHLDDAALLDFVQQDHCRRRTAYAAALANWQRVFGAENVLLLFFDDLARAPEDVVDALDHFLGLSPAGRAGPVPLPGRLNSYRQGGEVPPMGTAKYLAQVSLEEIAALRALGLTAPALGHWEQRAQAALTGRL